MNVYQLDEPDQRYVFLDWDEIFTLECDLDGVTIGLREEQVQTLINALQS